MAPSNILLSGSSVDLSTHENKEFIMSELLDSISRYYDICIIDCSPSLELLPLNSLVASTDVIIPVQTEYYALEGLKQVLETINIVRERFNQNLKTLGILLTFADRTTLSRQVQSELREYFGDMVFNTVIHRTVRLAEAPSASQSIISYSPQCKGASEYRALVKEMTYKLFKPALTYTA